MLAQLTPATAAPEPDLFTATISPPQPTPVAQTAAPLSRSQVVERIMSLNPTAGVDFLARFPDQHLANYLDHLVAAQTPRGRSARWVRTAETPAILVAEPRD